MDEELGQIYLTMEKKWLIIHDHFWDSHIRERSVSGKIKNSPQHTHCRPIGVKLLKHKVACPKSEECFLFG